MRLRLSSDQFFARDQKGEDSATGEIVGGLNIHQAVKNHVANYFPPKSKQKNLASRFCVQIVDHCRGSAFRNFAKQF